MKRLIPKNSESAGSQRARAFGDKAPETPFRTKEWRLEIGTHQNVMLLFSTR